MTSLLNIGRQALQAQQTALSVTGQNIANVNTPGYSRQVADFESRPMTQAQAGVLTGDIRRIADAFATRQVWSDTAGFQRHDAYATLAASMDTRLTAEGSSLSVALDDFFGALQTVSDSPTSLTSRELFMAESESLVRSFHDMASFADEQNQGINRQLETLSAQVTTLGEQVANLNGKIQVAEGSGGSGNELRDQRDELVKQLAELIDVNVIQEASGSFNILLGSGQPLVVGNQANQLKTIDGDPDASQHGLALVQGGRQTTITDQVAGGQAGGLIAYREEVLNPTLNQLGEIALAISDSFNALQQQGMDLDGKLGTDLFSDLTAGDSGAVRGYSANTGTLDATSGQVTIDDASLLTGSDYELRFSSSSRYTLTRLSDNEVFSSNTTDNPLPLSRDGFTIDLGAGTAAVGDRFLIQPTRFAAANIEVALNDGRQLALASPLSATANPANTGTGEIVSVDLLDRVTAFTGNTLDTPVEVEFDQNGDYLIYPLDTSTNPPTRLAALGPASNTMPIDINGEYSLTLTGSPAAGDVFRVLFNQDGISDNRNALAMIDLQQQDLVGNGSIQDAYGSTVGFVGTKANLALSNAEAGRIVLTNSENSRSSLSGVNLDEEAANLLKFEQAYNAAAQMISVSRTLFDTLLNSVR